MYNKNEGNPCKQTDRLTNTLTCYIYRLITLAYSQNAPRRMMVVPCTVGPRGHKK